MMTTDLLVAILRTLLQMLGAAAMSYGIGTQEQWTAVAGGAVALTAVVHMIWARWGTAKVPVK
jgi:membrane protein YdbS with pleckstrin-like domain